MDAESRRLEESLFQQVADEIGQGIRREGLWAKALANAQGSPELARSLYIKLRVQALKDEIDLAEEQQELDRERREKERIDARVKELANAPITLPRVTPWVIALIIIALVIILANR